MEACGIIAEYNPLHSGHIHHLSSTRQQTGLPIIVAMSGSFMQRGEAAILDKFTRAQTAVNNGADLVLELPTSFTLRSAQYFATGGVKLLQATGLISTLSCGTEHPEYPFEATAKYMLSSSFQKQLHEQLQTGNSYAAACAQLLQKAQLISQLDSPNDILALEYTKALLDTSIKPLYIARQGQGYNSTTLSGCHISASAIRQQLTQAPDQLRYAESLDKLQTFIAKDTRKALKAAFPLSSADQLWSLLKYQLLLHTPEQLLEFTLANEGLEYLLNKALQANSLEEALSLCVGKRYSSGRIRRLFCQLLLNLSKEHYQQEAPAYIRILAFNDTGRQLIKQMKETATLPLLTKLGNNPYAEQKPAFKQQLELDIRATDCWALLHLNQLPLHSDFLNSPSYISQSK